MSPFLFDLLKTRRAWRIPSIFQALPSLLQALGIFFVPESPRFLVSKGREDVALGVLAHYHSNGDREDEVVQFEYREIVGTIELEIAAKQTRWSELWRTPGNKWRIFIMIVRKKKQEHVYYCYDFPLLHNSSSSM